MKIKALLGVIKVFGFITLNVLLWTAIIYGVINLINYFWS